MPPNSSRSVFRPFEQLDSLIRGKKLTLARADLKAPQSAAPEPALPAEKEAELFARAMADVTPLPRNRRVTIPKGRIILQEACDAEDQKALESLQQLVECGDGFVVAQTSEYMETTGPGACPEIARRLHQGHYAVQDHVDLHGLSVPEAETVLHDFIRQSLVKGHRTVLVVHGRGLTSPHRPVLKFKVYEWLTQGPLRKHVIAMTSARSCDGGAGASYVLMRRQPMTKRLRKKMGALADFFLDIGSQMDYVKRILRGTIIVFPHLADAQMRVFLSARVPISQSAHNQQCNGCVS